MKKVILGTGAAVLSALLALSAVAQSISTIDKREQNQERRIEKGFRSGELTPEEAGKLDYGQERVDRLEKRVKADGVVTPSERARVEHVQDVQSLKIHEAKHNDIHDLNHNGVVDGAPLPTPTISQRQNNQEHRIQRGVITGQLTSVESKNLERGQEQINHLKARAQADGIVTRRERQRIQQAQRIQNHKIHLAKHNKLHDRNHNGIVD